MAQIDYYKVLKALPGASEVEIRKAYKLASKKWHPDKNPNNQTEADKKFKEISEAYGVLSDEKKRRVYDKIYKEAGSKTKSPGACFRTMPTFKEPPCSYFDQELSERLKRDEAKSNEASKRFKEAKNRAEKQFNKAKDKAKEDQKRAEKRFNGAHERAKFAQSRAKINFNGPHERAKQAQKLAEKQFEEANKIFNESQKVFQESKRVFKETEKSFGVFLREMKRRNVRPKSSIPVLRSGMSIPKYRRASSVNPTAIRSSKGIFSRRRVMEIENGNVVCYEYENGTLKFKSVNGVKQ